MSAHADLVIIGAGQSGLAAAHAARQAGLEPIVLEAGPEPVGSWPQYYDSLELFSPARYSELPGLTFPGDRDRYPTRDELVGYLRAYAAHLDADIRCGQHVDRVEALPGAGFEIHTRAGDVVRSQKVIAATGGFGSPNLPALPGLDVFGGRVLHAADYRRPDDFAAQRVIVVGAGNSAVQIAAELAEVATVRLATRGPLRWLPQRPLGRDLHWWLTTTRFDTAPVGRRLARGSTPVLDDGRWRAAVAHLRRPMFVHLTGDGVVWSDGGREPVDAIVLATGYRPHLPYLPAAALDEHGEPHHRAGVSTTVPGLGYVGLHLQRSFASATVRGVAADAAFVIGALDARTERRRTASPALRRLCCPSPAS